ncbi:hypothetical protein D3C84_743190 [compost metagenome]
MTQPENSKAPSVVQPPVTSTCRFANMGHGELLAVREGIPSVEALMLARQLANGIAHIAEHIADVINYEGDAGYLDEMRALSFLGATVGALVRAAEVSLEEIGGAA